MSSPEDRMSTTAVTADYLSPDERTRDLDEDYEAGPVALSDPSQGLDYQVWHLTWDFATGDFTVTPETSGSPSVIINAANVTQCSLAFDNNGRVNIAYTANGQAYLYWYDTVAGSWTTDALEFGIITPTLTLDDKRTTQTGANDILLFYTKDNGDGTYSLYRLRQRDRYGSEKLMLASFPPYLYKLGMHSGLRVQVAGSEVVI
jgi:hypothetical protein